MAEPTPDERRRLSAVYGGYEQDGSIERWDPAHPGNAAILDERDERVGRLVQSISAPGRTLEIGCGRGDVLAALPTEGDHRIGVDLLADRLRTVGRDRPELSVVLADGSALPFPDGSIDLLVAFTVFSSVRPSARATIAAEITRVARPGATLLWYDMRWPNPANPAVRPVGRRGLGELFPHWDVAVDSVTVVPALARRLGPATDRWYPRLARMPFLRSHLVGALRRS